MTFLYGGREEKYKRKLIGESPKIKGAYQSRPTDIQIIIYKQSTGHKFHSLVAKTKTIACFYQVTYLF